MTTIIVPFEGYTPAIKSTGWSFEKIARRRNLAISARDEAGNSIFALDTTRRALLFAKKDTTRARCLVIDLNNIDRCSLKKEYHAIAAGELKYKKLFHFIKRICIHLGVKNSSRTLTLSLFDAGRDQAGSIQQIESKASKWVAMVSKLLTKPTQNT